MYNRNNKGPSLSMRKQLEACAGVARLIGQYIINHSLWEEYNGIFQHAHQNSETESHTRTASVPHRRQSKLLTRWHISPKAELFSCFQRSCSSSVCQPVRSWKEKHPMANCTYFLIGKVVCQYEVKSLAQYHGSWTITWQKSTSNDIVASLMKIYRSLGLEDDCLEALQNTFCSQYAPRCSPADDTSDYGDKTTLCNDVYSSCPQNIVDRLKKNNFCQSLKTGKNPNTAACVAPSTSVTGVCPQPQFKVSVKSL